MACPAHPKVTWKACSLPVIGHGAPGCPVTIAVRFRLVPPGPTANTRKVFPAFADVKHANMSNRLHVNGLICPLALGFIPIVILFAGFAVSWKITLVTLNTPSGPQKHAPLTSRSWHTEQSPFDGVTLNTSGALVPRLIVHLLTRVNGPNALLSPAVNVVVTVTVATPPQQNASNPVPGMLCSGFITAVTKLQFTGVTLPNTNIVESGVPSPFVSHCNVAAVVTVFPGLDSGCPVSASNP